MDEIQITQIEFPQDKRLGKRAANKPAKVHKIEDSKKPAAEPSHMLSPKKAG